jgi:hypothetical protein
MKAALIFIAFTSLAVAVQGAAYHPRDRHDDLHPSSLLDSQVLPKQTPDGSTPPGPPPIGSMPPGPAPSSPPDSKTGHPRQDSPISLRPTTSCQDGQAPPNQTPGGSMPPGPLPSGLPPTGKGKAPDGQGQGHPSVRPNSNPSETPRPNSTPGSSAQPSPIQAN